MSDIKPILSLLCQYLSAAVDVTFKPEYFRLAKFNNKAENVAEALWKTLDTLSFQVLREKGIQVDFQEYDKLTTIKLHFALLRYPALKFYALTEKSIDNRQLLLAFVWLLATQDALNIIVRNKLAFSVLGRESWQLKTAKKEQLPDCSTKSLTAQMNNIIYLNGKVNYNLKDINELLLERAKLVAKAHAASLHLYGLPHLNISELSLAKRISTITKNAYSSDDKRQIKELQEIGKLLEMHLIWTKKEQIFFEWMVTVITEHNKSLDSKSDNVDWKELSKFVSLLRDVINEKLQRLSENNESYCFQYNIMPCVSRLQRTQENDTEVGVWLTEAHLRLTEEMQGLSRTKEELSKELKGLLKLIPSCVQV